MKRLFWVLSFLCGAILNSQAFAATVTKLKGDKVLITFDDMAPNVGDQFFGMDAAGKKKAIIRITAVKNGQGIGQVIKGKAEVGQTLAAKGAGAGGGGSAGGKSSLSHFGILVSYLINKMDASFTFNGSAQTASMAGNGFGALGYYDYGMTPSIDLRGSAGIEQFQVSETHSFAACDKGTTTTCNALITYLSAYGLGKFNYLNGATKAWVGAGGGYLFALTKASTVLDSSQISANYVLSVATGVDLNMSRGQYIPFVIEYSMFPSSSTVKASYIAFRVGWGWR